MARFGSLLPGDYTAQPGVHPMIASDVACFPVRACLIGLPQLEVGIVQFRVTHQLLKLLFLSNDCHQTRGSMLARLVKN
jgi:hypothetical protein